MKDKRILVMGDIFPKPEGHPELSYSRMSQEYLGRRLFAGKTIFVDLDGTLIRTEAVMKESDHEKREGPGGKAHVTTTYAGEEFGFEITEFNPSAKKFLGMVRGWGGRVFITSASSSQSIYS